MISFEDPRVYRMSLTAEEVKLINAARLKAEAEAFEAKERAKREAEAIPEPFKALIARWLCDDRSLTTSACARRSQALECANELRTLLLAEASKRPDESVAFFIEKWRGTESEARNARVAAEKRIGTLEDELRRVKGIHARFEQAAWKFIHNVDLYLVDCQGLIRLNVARKEFFDQLEALRRP